jgi:hypothetical protein
VLLGACILAVAIQALIPMVAPLADVFRAAPLDAVDWILVAIAALTPALVAQGLRARRMTWVA